MLFLLALNGSSTVKLAIRVKQKLLSYKSIFYACWTLFTKVYPRYDTAYYLAEIEKMLNCGTDLGGFALFGCCRCGKGRHKIFFSCKSNACLKCAKRYGREAMERITSKLFLGISYRQVVLTLPEQLRGPFYNHSNKDKLYSDFMHLAHYCLQDVIRQMFRNDQLNVAVIAFIHTNSRNGTYNPHLHVILGEGAFNPLTSEWLSFSKLPLQLLRKKWQYYLLTMVKGNFPERKALVDQLWNDYPNGFYTHPGNDKKVPTKNYRALIRYLTKYLSSPPIGLSRLDDFDGQKVSYRFNSHHTGQVEGETILALDFIGRMVQHILPKNFHRVRYYGLQATTRFKKHFELIAKSAGDMVDAMIPYVIRLTYAQLFEEVAKRNPL
ncbi:IS91 family transposase [Piscirickettsia salmonis]